MTVTSYAQNFEDIMLRRALAEVKNGFYLDVGACAPDADSVTRLFYEQGWCGINFEPNPYYLKQLEAQRPRDINLGLALSDTESTQTFHLLEGTGLSTLNSEVAAAHKDQGLDATDLSVPVSTLCQVWAAHVPPEQPVHFLKIDVEGEEAKVIRGGDWEKHRPWIVVVEATAPMSQRPSYEDWEPVLLSHGYSLAYWDGLNRFYVASEHAEYEKAFQTPPNVFDDFVSYAQVLIQKHAAHLKQEVEHLQNRVTGLEGKNNNLLEQVSAKDAQLALLHHKVQKLEVRLNYFKRPLLVRWLFKKNGRPKKVLRRAFFHTSGEPRKAFKRFVLKENGRPKKAFRDWMMGAEYQSLPKAVRMSRDRGGKVISQENLPSPRTEYFMERLAHSAGRNGSN